VPFIFGGGNNFVDVRDVAAGHLRAAERGRSGQRYLLTGTNRSFTSFFGDLTRVAGRAIPRLRVPCVLGRLIAAIEARLPRRKQRRSSLTEAQARLLGWYFYFTSAKAQRELGYRPRALLHSLADTHAFWMQRRAS
jgi:dihydroflavonol-4-reductase